MPTKAVLRRQLLQARQTLPAAQRAAKSAAIAERLQQAIDWSAVRNVHCFEPIAQLGEVDLNGFLRELQAVQPQLRLYTSRKIGQSWRTVSLMNNKPGDVSQFDVIIVPMLGFKPVSRQRLGYGGGYYDRFLAGQPAAQKIGVCFEQGRLKTLPTELHDIPLDCIITEDQNYC